MVLVDKSV